MEDLFSWNARHGKNAHISEMYPRYNGIACPQCGKELMDSDAYVLMSSPPQKNVHCPECGYDGYRYI